MITVAIVEDDREIRSGLQQFLDHQKDLSCPVAVESVEDLLHELSAKETEPNVILMDIGLPGMSGIDGIKILTKSSPDINIIVFTVHDDHDKVFDSLCAGASGYLLKNTPLQDIRSGIELLYSGGAPMSPQIARRTIDMFRSGKNQVSKESPLTLRENEIVIGLVDGLSYKLIADRMNISIETVRYHIKNIYQKLHVHCKADVITKSLRGEI